MSAYFPGCVVVTDYVKNDGSCDVSDAIQALIDENPNRTIFFPDGVYLLGKPIDTPAHPEKSVSLRLSDFAILRAAETFEPGQALVRLGAIHKANDIRTVGSNYSFEGGIVDGSGVADGISIDGGRETVIRNVSVKHTRIGVHIKYGANSGSSDADIYAVNVVGNKAPDSIGLLVEGFDNTVTNMRIADVQIGVKLVSSGNSLRNLHPLYTLAYEDYQNACGFIDLGGNNWYSFCYSDQFAVGFRLKGSVKSILTDCFCFWYAARGEIHTAVQSLGKFESIVTNLKLGFQPLQTANRVLTVDEVGGKGVLERISIDESRVNDDTYKAYLIGGSI